MAVYGTYTQFFAGDTDPEYKVFVAIDLGTTNSACAFAVGKESSEILYASEKIPTALMLDPAKRLHSFGKKAMDDYFQLEEEDGLADWYYFDRFKMRLHNDDTVRSAMVIRSVDGKTLPAKIVFGRTLQHFRELAIEKIGARSSSPCYEAEVKWILTVPAIWGDRAKEFMKSAAEEAGMNPDAVELALEPEGAAFRCRDDLQHVHRKIGSPPTLRYVVADCGGGTIDVTVHDMNMTTRKINEVHRATGGDWGGTSVDEEIRQLVRKIIGENVADRIKDVDWLRVCRTSIEEAKKKSGTTTENKVHIRMTPEMLQAIQECGGNIERSAAHFSGAMYRRSHGTLSIDLALIKDCFRPSLERIIDHLRRIVTTVGHVNCILVVGGYAESEILFRRIERDLQTPECTIIRPPMASLAVVGGAVVFGQNPEIVQNRKSKRSYGVACVSDFQMGKHKLEKMALTENGLKCLDLFKVYIQANETVPPNHLVRKEFGPVSEDQTEFCVELYHSPREGVEYIDDEECAKLGDLTVVSQHVERGFNRSIIVGMSFSGTTLKFGAVEKDTASESGEIERIPFKFECL